MREDQLDAEQDYKRIALIREEMRFEIGVLHDRTNALISSEAFLLISFTMSLAYSKGHYDEPFYWVSPILCVIGFTLAMLAWPGVRTSFSIVVDWNLLLLQSLESAREKPSFVWRPASGSLSADQSQAYHRSGLLFARCVPAVFAAAWIILAGIALTAPIFYRGGR